MSDCENTPESSTPARPGDVQAVAASACFNEDSVLRAILEGTARTTGQEFFQSLVRHLAVAINVGHAFVAEFAGKPTRVRTLAYWARGSFAPPLEWDLRGTPCEDVLRGNFCHHPAEVWRKFPDDLPLVKLGVESYLGVPLLSTQGEVVGHLAVFDERRMPAEPRRLSIFHIFAQRAAAEFDRLRVEQALRESEKRFRDLFDEAPIGYVYEDTETRFLSANRAAMRMLGLKPEDVPGTMGLSLVAPTRESQDRVHASLTAEQSGQEKESIELELRRKDNGKPVWVQRWSRPEPDGKHTRTMIIDITDQVLAQREKVRLQLQSDYLQEEIKAEHNFEEIIGNAPLLRRVLRQIEQVAGTDSTVLIQGETGTGKELVARAIHSLSRRKDRPLIKLNCAALPTGLVESELFGHEKGAFTGAVERRIGRFSLANGGTIFLDEIGDMPLETQVKLLRVLQEHELEPIGSTTTTRVDVRVIAATNRDLQKAIAENAFRADLYYRLNVFPIQLPRLRERTTDIPLLAHYFVAKYAARIGRTIERIDAQALERLMTYPWPGNIRELENVIERAVILSPGPTLEIELDALRVPETQKPDAGSHQSPGSPVTATHEASADSLTPLPGTLAEAERREIQAALRQTRGVIEGPHGAARILGLHPNTLRSRMKRLGIQRPGA